MSDATELTAAVAALKEGRPDEAIAKFEALADHGVVGTGVAFDRGIAYAARARSGQGFPGDLGRATHAFEEALRRDPHDGGARAALDEIRREIARRDVGGVRAEELGAPPMWRAIVVAAPGNVWAALALGASCLMAIALAARPRLQRGQRLAASTIAIVGFVVATVATGLGVGARYLRTHVREAVVVAPYAMATPEVGEHLDPLRLVEGSRVDVIEERSTTTLIRTDKGEGWIARDALRLLPPYRP